MNFKTNVLSIIIAFTLVLTGAAYYGTGFASAEAGGTTFTDLPTSHWAYSSVQKMQAKGIVKGYPDGSFGPSKTVTYGEFIKMAVVAVKGTDDITNAKDATHWASGYYKYAIENGIFHSGQIAEKQLGSTIPRDDMALICANAANLSEVNMKEVADKIPDVDKTTRNEYQIAQAYAEGLITGYEDGSFHPYGTLTRAEASTVILRIIDESARKVPEWTKEEQAAADDDTNWLTDEHGTYKYVNLSDFVDVDVLKNQIITDNDGDHKLPDYYYLPDKAKYYKTKLGAIWEPELSFSGRQNVRFDEFCMAMAAIKDKKVIAKNEGFVSAAPMQGDMWVSYLPDKLNAKTFDYIMTLSHANPHNAEECTPRIYENPFK